MPPTAVTVAEPLPMVQFVASVFVVVADNVAGIVTVKVIVLVQLLTSVTVAE